MKPEYFTDTNESNFAGYKAWEARCRELGLNGPFRVGESVEWQFVGPKGVAATYNAAQGKGEIFWFPDNKPITFETPGEPIYDKKFHDEVVGYVKSAKSYSSIEYNFAAILIRLERIEALLERIDSLCKTP